ncbi:MAG: hypothetical protein N2654_07705, partial [Deltaproteobacteria bacterium]|nr:hypothetical protein [Deltaproteobacteria bacterium]
DLTLFYPLLKQKGFLILKTDNFEVISSVFRHYFECFSLIRLHFPYIEPIKKFRTDFEKLFLSKKGNIWCMCLQPNLVCLNSVTSERAELG